MKTLSINPLTLAVSLAAGFSTSLATASDDALRYALEEVVVTATKRAESIQDVPISVSAFSGDFLEKSGLEDLEDISQIAPNLNINKSSQAVNQRIAIRGVGTVGNNAMDPSVAVYIDGAYMPRPGAVLGNLKDLEVAEVLRGPQGTLFGRNAALGALNLRTKAPVIGENTLKLEGGFGNYGSYDFGAIANYALGSNTALRTVVGHSNKDGFGENIYDRSDTIGGSSSENIKVSLLHEPADNLSILLRLDYQELQGEGPIVEVHPDSVTASRLANITARTGGAVPDLGGLDHTINQLHDDQMSDRQHGAIIDVTWDDAFAEHTIRSISAYRNWQNDTSENSVFRLPLDDLNRITHYHSESFSQELQLISPTGDQFDYIAGLYYFHEQYDINQTTHLGVDFCPVIAGILGTATASGCALSAQDNATPSEFKQSTDSLAAFFQGTLHINERFDVSAGIRYSDDDKDGSLLVSSNNPVASAFFAAPENHDLKFSDSQVTWMTNAKYFLDDDIMAFATVSTGYKSGGLNSTTTSGGLTAAQRLFDSEEVKNFELGLKSTLLDGLMTANATIYRTDIENFQDRSFDNLSFVISNAGELRQQGFELDLQYSPIEPLFIALGYAYLDSEFLNFESGSNLPGVSGTQDLTGTRNNFSPEHQFNLTSQWTQPIANSELDWFVRAEWSWQDDVNIGSTTNNNPQTVQDAYSIVNLRAGIAAQDGRWSVTAYVENLLDQDYCTAAFDQPAGTLLGVQSDGGTLIRCVQGDPRTFGIRASYVFE